MYVYSREPIITATEQQLTEATGGTAKIVISIDATIMTRQEQKPSKTYAMVALTTLRTRNSPENTNCTINKQNFCAILPVSF